MPNRDVRRWLGPVMMFTLDIILTLCGQRPEYWAGDYALVDEANPIAEMILRISPYLFLTVAVVWAVTLVVVVTTSSHPAAYWVAMIVTIAHSFGAASWCLKLGGILGIITAGCVFGLARLLWPNYDSFRPPGGPRPQCG